MRPTLIWLASLSLMGACDEKGIVSENGYRPEFDDPSDSGAASPDTLPGDTEPPVWKDSLPWFDPEVLEPVPWSPPVDSDTDTAADPTDTVLVPTDSASDTGGPWPTDTDGAGSPGETDPRGDTDGPGDTDPVSPGTDASGPDTDPARGDTDPAGVDTDGTPTGNPTPDTDPPGVDTDPPGVDTDPPGVDTDPPGVDTDPPGVDTDTQGIDTDGSPGDSDPGWSDTDPQWPETDLGWSETDGPPSVVDSDSDSDTIRDPTDDDCRIASRIFGWLDQFQTPGDGKVYYCHRTAPGRWTLVDTDISACVPHAHHLLDIFPTTLCDS